MDFDKVFVPKPIKQKEVIFMRIPWFGVAITKRQFVWFLMGFPFCILSIIILVNIVRPTDITSYLIIFLVSLSFPLFTLLISHKKTDDKYIEEIFFQKRYYKKHSAVILNKKALSNYKSSKSLKGGK